MCLSYQVTEIFLVKLRVFNTKQRSTNNTSIKYLLLHTGSLKM